MHFSFCFSLLKKGDIIFEAKTGPNLGGPPPQKKKKKKIAEQKCLIYKMGNFRELKNSKNNCSLMDINFREWAKKYLCNQVFENVVFLYI